ncbi:anaerobic ribonucleoside-triphosphate reductase domain protein [Lachnoanaerobaculum saburreum F0468]|uniref:Anaerobic ribonucleoside-triphosphate reductase domain protein n=2 Tax=Lachnoanaerobaculum saburreum TaxID=467210 RepID=I0R8Z6_9FIRM|nr:anaerobic ribonucleoside-triphosphate reductase domain protein [Lachnoanaerobaculum saburreum F0468]
MMYPEYLSLTGDRGIVCEVYKKYKKVISPMCCRAFLTKWFERGGENPADDSDSPVFTGRFNIGVVSLNLPMILAKAMEDNKDFYEVLDCYLEIVRKIHKSTYKFLTQKRAYTNPLAFMQGGLYGGHLNRDDKIEPLLKSATASFGITALNELQYLYNRKSIVEDGKFVLEVAEYINIKVTEFQRLDHIQYSVYGTLAESLCGKQVKSFRDKFGNIENVSDRDYFSNSFHCHVSEDITQIEKQDYEARFWDFFNGGKIQYVRVDVPYNIEGLEAYVTHAMKLGLYEGINISLAYCDNCWYQWNNIGSDRPDTCPRCGKKEMTMIDRMCGYIAFTKIHGKSRLNDAKMAEIHDRISM